ncbi:MAG: ABC transporter permease [Dysgonomonas sp.]
MKALGLIIQREFFSRVKKKAFILTTILTPFLFAGFVFIPLLLAQIKDSEVKKVVVLDHTGIYASHFQSSGNYQFEAMKVNSGQDSRPQAGGEMFALLEIKSNLTENPKAATIYSEKQVPMDLLTYINHTLSETSREYRLESYTSSLSVDKEVVQGIQNILESKSDISVNTIRWDETGKEKEMSVELAAGIGFAMVMLMYIFILTYGAMVMQGVIEEKTNRIVEVMISSVRPFDLMMGKIIGIGLTGFVQLFIWICLGGILFVIQGLMFSPEAMGAGSADIGSHDIQSYMTLLPTIDWGSILLFFILFFIGGYLIYASLFAMFASAVDNSQDTQQFVMPITIVFIFSLMVGMYSVQNPDGPLAFWCSFIPFTSPIVMMVRVPADIPLWEILVSLVVLYLSVFVTIRFAAKIYRVGILMYGKKPSVKELYKWFKYK